MQHCIETNVTAGTQIGTEDVRRVLTRKVDEKDMALIDVSWNKNFNVVVTIRGNGALLRDACFALDVAGMLD